MKQFWEKTLSFNPDPRKKYRLNLENEADVKMVEDVQKSIRVLTKICFQECLKTPRLMRERCLEGCIDRKIDFCTDLVKEANLPSKRAGEVDKRLNRLNNKKNQS